MIQDVGDRRKSFHGVSIGMDVDQTLLSGSKPLLSGSFDAVKPFEAVTLGQTFVVPSWFCLVAS